MAERLAGTDWHALPAREVAVTMNDMADRLEELYDAARREATEAMGIPHPDLTPEFMAWVQQNWERDMFHRMRDAARRLHTHRL
jgi:hypothetical protein